MRQILKRCIASTALAVGITTSAHAVTFDFSAPLPVTFNTSIGFSQDGTSFTVSAFSRSGLGIFQSDVAQGPLGLGVGGSVFDLNPFVDGGNGFFGLDDFLVFDFDRDTVLESALLQALIGDYDVFVDTGSGLNRIINEGTSNPIVFAGLVVSQLVIGADSTGDSFAVRELSATAVPLPATGLLLIGGLAGFAAVRRRRHT